MHSCQALSACIGSYARSYTHIEQAPPRAHNDQGGFPCVGRGAMIGLIARSHTGGGRPARDKEIASVDLYRLAFLI